jgi:hypothetical protein
MAQLYGIDGRTAAGSFSGDVLQQGLVVLVHLGDHLLVLAVHVSGGERGREQSPQ